MIAIRVVFKPLFGHNIPPVFWEFLDPILLTLIVAPVLHYSVWRPMKAQQTLLEQQKDDLVVSAVTFNSQEGVVVTDVNHNILKVNQSFTDVTGYSSEEAVGKTPALLSSGRQDKEFYLRMRKILERDKYWQGEIWNRRKNGEIYPEWLTITGVSGEKELTYYVGIFSDITQRKASERRIKFLAYHDQLTGLPNRELFYDRLSFSMSQARRRQGHLALLYLDLDGFKPINDNYGHEAGDEILRTTAKRLLSCVRDTDTVARLGGDEFAIVLSEIETPADVTGIAEKIILKLNESFLLNGGKECGIGVSIGIAIYPDDGTEIDSLMSAADCAMYESKSGNKNTYTFCGKSTQGKDDNQPWIILDDAYVLGIPEMDRQHADMVGALNKLNASIRNNDAPEMTARLFDEFVALVASHFKTEDDLMDLYDYADSAKHKTEHLRMIQEVTHLKEKFVHGNELIALQSLKDWLTTHVLDWDKQIADFLLQRGLK